MVVVQGGGQWHCQSRNIGVMLRTGGGNWLEWWMDKRKTGAVMEEDRVSLLLQSCPSCFYFYKQRKPKMHS